jgi:Galactose oxidase, central domain
MKAVPEPATLMVARKQSLTLSITSQGYDAIYIKLPLGDIAGALMTKAEFDKKRRFPKAPATPNGQPPKDVLTPANSSGAIRIPFGSADSLLAFNITIEDFMVAPGAGKVDITLHGDDPASAVLDTAKVTKSESPVEITSFTADAYNVLAGKNVKLEWTINQSSSYKLTRGGETVESGDGKDGSAKGQPPGDYVLKAGSGDKDVNNKRLRIQSFNQTGTKSYALQLRDCAGIVGFHAYPKNGRLYVLLRSVKNPDEVQLWSTPHGFDEDPATYPVRWRREQSNDKDFSIPLDVARRPGAIFQDKLWLMGGDCCDPDLPGRGVAYFDLQQPRWHVVEENDPRNWPKKPSAPKEEMASRMGHAVVVLKEDQLWVMGGWNQNGGACADIWEFDGNAWTQRDWDGRGRCLFGATVTDDAVWTSGGFMTPGGQGDCLVRRYDKEEKKWDQPTPDKPLLSLSNLDYCASALFSLNEGPSPPYGIGAFYDPGPPEYIHQPFSISIERGRLNSASGPKLTHLGSLLQRDYFHLQSTVFQGACFFRALQRDNKWADGNVNYLVWVRET